MFKITKQVKGRTGFKTSDQTPLTTDTKLLTVAILGGKGEVNYFTYPI